MGCSSSSEKEEALQLDGPWTVETLDAAIDAQTDKYSKFKNRQPWNPVQWSTMKNIILLSRKRSEMTREVGMLDYCLGILRLFLQGDGAGQPQGFHLWVLLTLGEVMQERFEITKKVEDIDGAIITLLYFAEESGSTGLEASVPLARALKASYENRPPEMDGETYILQTIWPRLEGTAIGIHVMRNLGFFWRLEYMQTGDLGTLRSCIEVTKATAIVVMMQSPEQVETILNDLTELMMMTYFHPAKDIDTLDITMPEWATIDEKSGSGKLGFETAILPQDVSRPSSMYQPLQRRENRLVELLPGESGSQICCRLFVESLDRNPVFEAVSYDEEDGDKDKKSLISVNDSLLAVTDGLHRALCLVRSKIKPRVLWVDVLCIDEENLQEKSSQVGTKRDIFSQAHKVLMCIGGPDDTSTDSELDKFFRRGHLEEQDFVSATMAKEPRLEVYDWTEPSNLQGFFHAPLSPTEWPVLGAVSIIFYLAHGHHLGDMPFFRMPNDPLCHQYYAWRKSALAVQALCSQSYWYRAWTLQEVAMAKEAVVYYGNHIIPFKFLIDAHDNLMQHSMTCCSAFSKDTPGSRDDFDGWMFILSGFLSLMQPIKMRMIHLRHKAGAEMALSLREILENGGIWKEATDPRDFVYSALGLVLEDVPNPIQIDYNLSVAQVFAHAAIKVFEDDRDLSALTFLDAGRDDDLGLPSWVPDWRFKCQRDARRGVRLNCTALQYSVFDAASGREFNGRLQGDLCLALQSVRVDRISAVGSYWSPDFKEGEKDWDSPGFKIQSVESITSQISEWRRVAGLPDIVVVGKISPREREFWRTMFADTIYERKDSSPMSTRRMISKDFVTIQRFQEQLKAKKTPKSYPELFLTLGPNLGSFHNATVSRRFFVTEAGRFGLGLTSPGMRVEQGDEVYVVEGSKLPIVLRKIGSDVVEEKDSLGGCNHMGKPVYRCLGPAYLDGVMNGEAIGSRQVFSDVYLR